MNIKSIVIPAAGLGTRFLPYTATIAKEMLPILNLPAIHYIIKEGIDSGIFDFKIIANPTKQSLFDYFTDHQHLHEQLSAVNKAHLLQEIATLSSQSTLSYIEQKEPKGLGDAILHAQDAIGDHFFGIMLPDDILLTPKPALLELIEVAQAHKVSVIAVQEVPEHKISSYGIIKIKQYITDTIVQIEDVIEKPSCELAPSRFAIVGRYVLSPLIFDCLKKTPVSANGELQLTDGIKNMIAQGHKVYACIMNTERLDVGNPYDWLYTNIVAASKNSSYKAVLEKIKNLLLSQ